MGGAVCRSRYRSMPLLSAPFRELERRLLRFLGVGFSCQRGCRRFESGLVLQFS
jgi:hypothetical protein